MNKQQIENIAIDYGLIYLNYGETDATRLEPIRGGGKFTVEQKIRQIVFDGQRGRTKGGQVVEEMDAMLKVVMLDSSVKSLALALPTAILTGDGTALKPYVLTGKATSVGVIPDTAYLKNVTMFCKTVKGEYRKITLYNAMVENGLGFEAKPKGETEVELSIYAHWDAVDDTKDLYKIETVATIA